jgi:hypothetical protein
MKGALDQLCDQILRSLYPAHPEFPEKVTPGQRRTTWAQVQRALGDPDQRVVVEQKDRAALRNVANILKLGTMHESHFVLERHWVNKLDRYLAAGKQEQRNLSVLDLRNRINGGDGPEKGLPPEIADLVILTVAAQTDHAIKQSGLTLDPDGGSALPSEALLVPEVLPNDADWKVATQRAAGIFGANASPMVSAPEVARLADTVKAAATRVAAPAADLVAQLEAAVKRTGASPDGNRARNARAGRDLVVAIQEAGAAHAVVEVLARAQVPTSEVALGRSLTSAHDVSTALAETVWDLVLKSGPTVMEPLRRVLADDEIADSYLAARKTLQQQAAVLIPEVNATSDPAPAKDGGSVIISAIADLDQVTTGVQAIVNGGRRARVTWEPVEIE